MEAGRLLDPRACPGRGTHMAMKRPSRIAAEPSYFRSDGYTEGVDKVSEERLRIGEERPTNHDHAGVEVADDSLRDHLVAKHLTLVPDGLSFGALRGMHDRFHGEAHAADE